jgi:hypothetical protein
MTKHTIKHRFTGAVLFEGEFASLRECLEAARRAYTNISGAHLFGANLFGASLSRADLSGADLSRADLSGADFSRADLSGANISRANLSGANLSGAALSRADLSGANISGAFLCGASLSRADLYGANLSGANLSGAGLSGAYLSGAYLSGATVRNTKLGKRGSVKEVTRSDGYRFQMFDCEDGQFRILAGCRWFTLPEARRHWTATRDGTPLGEETFDILVLFERHVERLAKEPA